IGTVSDGRVVLKENRIMMVSDEMGDIPAGNTSGLGLYFSDTRFLSAYEFRLYRLQPILLSASFDESYLATFQIVNHYLLCDVSSQVLTFTYDDQDGMIRRTEVVVNRAPTTQHEGTLTWRFPLTTKETVTLVIDIIPLIGENEPMLSYLYDDALQALQSSYRR